MSARRLAGPTLVVTLWCFCASAADASSLADLRLEGIRLLRVMACAAIWDYYIDTGVADHKEDRYTELTGLNRISNAYYFARYFSAGNDPNTAICGNYTIEMGDTLHSQIGAVIRNNSEVQLESLFYPVSASIAGENLGDPNAEKHLDEIRNQWAKAADTYAKSILATAGEFSRTAADADALITEARVNVEDGGEQLEKMAKEGGSYNVPQMVIGDMKALDVFIGTIKFRD